MKKAIIFIVGALILVVLIAIWVYLLFFGTPREIPNADDAFSVFGPAGSVDPNLAPIPEIPVPTEQPETEPTNTTAIQGLKQLTTVPVAGIGEVVTGSSTYVYYAEKGTGHIFSIDTMTGTEERIAATTIAQAYEASFSKDGRLVAITTPSNVKTKLLTVAEINRDATALNTLYTDTVYDVTFDSSHNVLFTTGDGKTLTAHRYNTTKKTKETLFTLPFFEAKIAWGAHSTSSHLVYPKTARDLEGALYEVTNNGTITRLPYSGFAFAALGNNDIILYNKIVDNTLTSFVLDRTNGQSKPLLAPVLPEKCAVQASGSFIACGFSTLERSFVFPDNWYRGEITLNDTIYGIDGLSIQSVDYGTPGTSLGRPVDAVQMQISTVKRGLYFINKIDNTAWMYGF